MATKILQTMNNGKYSHYFRLTVNENSNCTTAWFREDMVSF